VDNLTHSLLGAALARTPLGKLHPKSTLLLVIAANLPDLDIVSLLGGKETYLVQHRGITHSVFGVAAQIVLMAAVVRAWEAWRAQRGGARASSWRDLLLLCGAGLASHPLLDYLNTYGVRPWLPFDATWYYGDLVFIVDPWLWLIFGGVAASVGPRSRTGDVWLGIAALLGSFVIYDPFGLFAASPAPFFFGLVWLIAVLAIAFVRAFGGGIVRPSLTLALGAALTATYLTGLARERASAALVARDAVRQKKPQDESIVDLVCMPQPCDPRHWWVLVETESAIYLWGLDVGDIARTDKHSKDPSVERALSEPCTTWWRSFARIRYAELTQVDQGTFVRLLDARYDAPWCTATVLIQPDGTALCLDERSGSPPPPPLPSAR